MKTAVRIYEVIVGGIIMIIVAPFVILLRVLNFVFKSIRTYKNE